jgi:hypothetical protein
MPDPGSITAADWLEVGKWLTRLWVYFFCIVAFAFTFLTAHAIIPSLVSSGHLPGQFMKLRGPMYLTVLIFAGLAALFMVWTVDHSLLLEDVYNRFWI